MKSLYLSEFGQPTTATELIEVEAPEANPG